MVGFNFWDKFFGKKPKTFKKEADKQIKENTLYYMQDYGRARWIPVEEIFEKTIEQTSLFNSNEGKMFFAKSGIRNKINNVTHILRREGHPIISGKGKKGYRYADEKCKDFVDRWNEKFNAWDERKSNLEAEREIDIQLIENLIQKLLQQKREQEAKQLQTIIIKYKNKEINFD